MLEFGFADPAPGIPGTPGSPAPGRSPGSPEARESLEHPESSESSTDGRSAAPKSAAVAPAPQAKRRAPRRPAHEEAHDVLVNFLPWGVSILFHAGLLILAVFVVWTTAQNQSEDPEENQPIIPIARLGENPGGSLSMQTGPNTAAMAGAVSAQQRLVAATAIPTASVLSNRTSGGSTVGAASGGAGQGAGSEIGLGGGWGGGSGGPSGAGRSNPFGMGGGAGGGGAFRASFMGSGGGNARKIVYLIDASGSMIDSFPFVLRKLRQSVNELSDKQEFTVIFFGGDMPNGFKEVPPPGLKKATVENKNKVFETIDPKTNFVVPSASQTGPGKAITAALRYKPHLLFILSDDITGQGRYEVDRRYLLAEVRGANNAHTKINTIQFLYKDKLEGSGLKPTLQAIADESGGIYKFVDKNELGIE